MKKGGNKFQLILAVGAMSVLFAFYPFVQDRLGMKGPITFNKKQFHLCKSTVAAGSEITQEYLPTAQKLKKFSEKLSLTLFDKGQELKILFLQSKAELEEVCAEDPYYTQFVMEAKNKNEKLLFYTSSKKEKGQLLYTEFGILRFIPVVLNNKNTGVVKCQYTRRDYQAAASADPVVVAGEYSGLVSQFSFLEIPGMQRQ